MKFDQSGVLRLSNKKIDNVVEHDGVFYKVENLSASFDKSKGGNSSVFILKNPNDGNKSIIKFSRYNVQPPIPIKMLRELTEKKRKNYQFIRKRNARFEQEIDALKIARDSGFLNIVDMKFHGEFTPKGDKDKRVFPYFVMEKADTDLKEFILENKALSIQDRLGICIDIMKAVKELHGKTIYHRDIKPDNILLFNKSNDTIKRWKLSDLGLVYNGLREGTIDTEGERIGPYGWLSPEAMNKFLTEKSDLEFDCNIDDCSDIFQLGKVFWFIFQGNVPIGQIRLEDFRLDFSEKTFLFNTLKSMLEYGKSNRIIMKDLEENMHMLAQEVYAVRDL